MRIGIVTKYYKNRNYGGLLQSYALSVYLNNQLYNSEQICYDCSPKSNSVLKKRRILQLFNIKRVITKLIIIPIKRKKNKRNFAFNKFDLYIPHSIKVYYRDNINCCIDDYDLFIVGSDQVWNLDWFDHNYFLEFVPNNKKKISYAASLGHSSLTEERKKYFKNILPSFDAISVREKDAVDLLQPLTDKKVAWVLDPTLLLDKSDWDEICPERRIGKKYLFCYFLGSDKRIRKLAKQYAKKHKLKIVTLPHLCGIAKSDIGFGDYKLYDVTPNDFISLIKYADCVFTDSFHACVFSTIYNKNFYVFNRLGMENMVSRIYSLTELFECQEHFCDTDDKFNMDYIEQLQSINYDKDFQLLKTMKEKSTRFLLDNLKD